MFHTEREREREKEIHFAHTFKLLENTVMIFSLCQTHFILLIKLLIYLLTDSNICSIYILIKHLSFYVDVLFFSRCCCCFIIGTRLVVCLPTAAQTNLSELAISSGFGFGFYFILFYFYFFFSYPQCVYNLLAVCCQYVLCVYVIFIYILYLFFTKKHVADCAKRF